MYWSSATVTSSGQRRALCLSNNSLFTETASALRKRIEWANEPHDLWGHNIKYLPEQISQGNWASRFARWGLPLAGHATRVETAAVYAFSGCDLRA
jgi:hypothetical protein